MFMKALIWLGTPKAYPPKVHSRGGRILRRTAPLSTIYRSKFQRLLKLNTWGAAFIKSVFSRVYLLHNRYVNRAVVR